MVDAIKITGLAEFTRSLKRLDSDLPKVLRVAFNTAGARILGDARSAVPSRSGRAAGSVKGASTATAFRIKGGSARVPYYPWLDFGGRVGKRGSVKRPFIKEGRYIYASYYKHHDELGTLLEGALLDAARAAGLEVD